MGPEGLRTETPEGERGQPVLVLRADGSFDLSNTIFGGIEGIERLRKKGDRAYLGSGDDSKAEFIQVDATTYAPTRSELILLEHHKDPAEQVRTLFSAQLISPAKLLFVSGAYGPGATGAIETAVLVR